MHTSEEAQVSITSRPAINVDGYYTTLVLHIGGELAAAVDLLTYSAVVTPADSERLVWAIGQLLRPTED